MSVYSEKDHIVIQRKLKTQLFKGAKRLTMIFIRAKDNKEGFVHFMTLIQDKTQC